MRFLPVIVLAFWLLVFSMAAHADVYVVYAPDTKAVYSLSDANDAVVPAGMSVEIIKGQSAADYLLQAPAAEYLYNGKKLKLDIAKQNKKAQDQANAQARADELNAIKNRSMLDAYTALKAAGKTFTYYSEKDFQ